MQVSDPNDVKIYNLSAGKSLPDWLSDRKKRALMKKDIDVRRRIELLQDFDMPGVSTTVRLSKDGHYVFATGIYKPRVRCFEVDNLSMKFERCFDSEVVTFEILSDDYSKLVFLQHDRFVEFHAAGGRYYRLRIPKYGRDMKYHYSTCDLYLVGAGSDIYRLNLERGQFLNPLASEGTEINKVVVNPVHQLVVVGTKEGKVEAWDPRVRNRVGVLDCALSCVTEDSQLEGFPSVSALAFKDALNLGVGTATGQVLLYDIRSDKPVRIKDHMNVLPIKDLAFHEDYVLSMDMNVVKIWERETGKLFTYIESGSETIFNSLCHVPNSGLMFMANENTKILAYYIPTLGPAPRWCSFLDNLTEELEESKVTTVYDDYKFVTKKELEELGLGHLLGTNMLRAYMHGFFVNARLYTKAKSISQPFAYEEYKKRRIREKIEEDRASRVQVKKLPKVNKDLALKLIADANNPKKKKNKGDLLNDDRFKALFENPDFQVDPNAEEYRLLNPVLSRLDKGRKAELQKELLIQKFEPVEDDEIEGKPSSEESSEESSDDEREWIKEVKKQHKLLKKERDAEERAREELEEQEAREKAPKLYELRPGEEFSGVNNLKESVNNLSLGERIQAESHSSVRVLSSGNRELTFTSSKGKKRLTAAEVMENHKIERKKLTRPAPLSVRKKMFKSFNKPFYKKRR